MWLRDTFINLEQNDLTLKTIFFANNKNRKSESH